MSSDTYLQPAAPGYDGTVQWFGPKWDAGITDEAPQVEVPVGQQCMECGEKIIEEDRGVMIPHMGILGELPHSVHMPHHLECFLISVVGFETTATIMKDIQARDI